MSRQFNRTPEGGLGCAFGRPYPRDPEWDGPDHCAKCHAFNFEDGRTAAATGGGVFETTNVWMVLKAAKLGTQDVDGVEVPMADCQLVLDPLSRELAQEIGESVAGHLFNGQGGVRPELKTVALDPRVDKQRMTARGAPDVPGTVIKHVEVIGITASRQVDEDSGMEWIKATIAIRFELGPRVHREWLVQYIAKGQYFTFAAEQLDMLERKAAGA